MSTFVRPILVLILALCLPSLAQAQNNQIVGGWSFDNTRIGTPENNQRFTIFFQFSPDGRFTEQVIGATPTQMSGQYQLSPDLSTLRLLYLKSEPLQVCLGDFCSPNQLAVQPGVTHDHPVQFQGNARFELGGDASGPLLFVRSQ